MQGAVIEAHAAWCGPCECMKLALGVHNENLKFGTASFDNVPLLKKNQGRVKPVFLILEDSN